MVTVTDMSDANVPLYKVLKGGKSCHGGDLKWSLPRGKNPGDWHEVRGNVALCHTGLHLTPNPAKWWMSGATAYLAEVDGEMVGDPITDDKVAVKRCRLIRKLSRSELEGFGLAAGGRTLAKALPKVSRAFTFIEAAWEGTPRTSWLRLNQTMRRALEIAISAEMPFNPDDFAKIDKEFRGGYWMGEIEDLYAAAIAARHVSACQSFEAWRRRAPFVWDGFRIGVGSSLSWDGLPATVTSFADDGGSLIACAYKPRKKHDDPLRIDRRFTISRAELQAAEKVRKVAEAERKDIEETMTSLWRRKSLRVSADTVKLWTPAQRSDARSWANGSGEKPAHVKGAA